MFQFMGQYFYEGVIIIKQLYDFIGDYDLV